MLASTLIVALVAVAHALSPVPLPAGESDDLNEAGYVVHPLQFKVPSNPHGKPAVVEGTIQDLMVYVKASNADLFKEWTHEAHDFVENLNQDFTIPEGLLSRRDDDDRDDDSENYQHSQDQEIPFRPWPFSPGPVQVVPDGSEPVPLKPAAEASAPSAWYPWTGSFPRPQFPRPDKLEKTRTKTETATLTITREPSFMADSTAVATAVGTKTKTTHAKPTNSLSNSSASTPSSFKVPSTLPLPPIESTAPTRPGILTSSNPISHTVSQSASGNQTIASSASETGTVTTATFANQTATATASANLIATSVVTSTVTAVYKQPGHKGPYPWMTPSISTNTALAKTTGPASTKAEPAKLSSPSSTATSSSTKAEAKLKDKPKQQEGPKPKKPFNMLNNGPEILPNPNIIEEHPMNFTVQCFTDYGQLAQKIASNIGYIFNAPLGNAKPHLPAGPATHYKDPVACSRISCEWSAAIFWCNLNDHELILDSFRTIAMGALRITAECATVIKDAQVVRGRAYSPNGWFVEINYSKC